MSFIDDIFSFVWDISDWFYQAYLTVQGWVWPFYLLGTPLYYLYYLSRRLLTPIAHFGDWVVDIVNKVSQILGPEGIISLLRTWLTYAENAWSWVSNAWASVTGIVGDWWAATTLTVQGWIDIAKQTLQGLINNLTNLVGVLQTAWDNFRTLTLPNLISSLDAAKLIDSTLKRWFPDYDDLVKLWANTKLFISSPLDWLWERFTDWFMGKE